MRQMDFGKPYRNAQYPFIKTIGDAPVLGITPGLNIMYKDNRLLCLSAADSTDVIACSAKGVERIRSFVEEAEDAGVFYVSFAPLPSCLFLSYMIEIAGNMEDFWQLAIGKYSTLVEQFYETIGITVDVQQALNTVMPMRRWPVGMRIPTDKLTMLIEPPDGSDTKGILHFTDRAIKVSICTQPEKVDEWFVRFPEYEQVQEYGVGVSRREYYDIMWGRLWMHVIAPMGFRCDELGIRCVEDEQIGVLSTISVKDIPHQGNVIRVHYPDEVYRVIAEYTRCM